MSDLLTISEVARILRVDDTTVRRWAVEGSIDVVTLPHARERKAYRIRRETVDAILNTPYRPVGQTGGASNAASQ